MSAPRHAVFISYRRRDSIYAVDRLDERLKHAFGAEAVFRDVRSIRKGHDFPADIRRALDAAQVGLVVIGPWWLKTSDDPDGAVSASRLDNPQDWVRIEIETLLKREGVPVIPLLLGGVDMPKADDLPETLRQLPRRDGMTLRPEPEFEDTVRSVIEEVGRVLEVTPRDPAPIVQVVPSRPPRVAPTRLSVTGREFVGRTKELYLLDEAWGRSSTDKINVVSLVGQGGEGKTAIVLNWYARQAHRGWQGVARVFDWSFYSQGSSAQSAATADEFFARAFEWFGYAGAVPKDAWAKGEKLAELIVAQRTLLVLDGLEPLQQPPGNYGGELKDPAMKALLRALAMNNPGLCVITTRTDVADLQSFESEDGSGIRHRLHALDADAARQLLRDLGVRGPDAEIDAVVREFRGHAYDLNLLGNYLGKLTDDNDIRRWREILLLEPDEHVHGRDDASSQRLGHGRRMLRAYERWLGPDSAAVAALRLLGLFDRPARSDLLDELRAEPAIPGLTDALIGLPDHDWLRALNQLEQLALITREKLDAPARSGSRGQKPVREGHAVRYAIDAHPLLREHFAAELRSGQAEAWRAAHRRLYEYLRDTTEYQPDGLDGLQPLYQAVTHGCLGGWHEEACDKIYLDRILRGQKYYSTRKLGAFGADLRAVTCFFEQPWTRLSPSLRQTYQAWLLNEAAVSLRALGRLSEALEPMRAGLPIEVERKDWRNAAIRASNLSELELTLGDVAGAVRDAERSVTFADRSGYAFQRMVNRATHADALHHAGQRAEALARFHEAEPIQAEEQPEHPLLYSVRGFRYCDLLLAEAERAAWETFVNRQSEILTPQFLQACHSVSERADQTLKWVGHLDLLSFALDHLTLGRGALYQFILASSSSVTFHSSLDSAVSGLRAAGQQDDLPRALLTRAWLRVLEGDVAGAHTDLDEAWQIAERGSMKLHMADIHLHRARLFRDKSELAKARTLIEVCGYWRRKEELEDAEAAAKDWPDPPPVVGERAPS